MPLKGAPHALARATDLVGKLAPSRALQAGLLATLLALTGCGSSLQSLTTGSATSTTSIPSLTIDQQTATPDHAAAADDRAAVTTAGATTASPDGAGGEGCGAIDGPGGRFVVTSEDHLRCGEALSIFRELFAARGQEHRGLDEAETYTEVDGWSCGSGAGGFGCERSGARIEAHSEG